MPSRTLRAITGGYGGRVVDENRRGRFLGVPYDWRRPSIARFKKTVWDPDQRRVWVPKSYGWGYSVNLAALIARLRRRRGTGER